MRPAPRPYFLIINWEKIWCLIICSIYVLTKYQTQMSASEILNVGSAADHIFLLYCPYQPPTQRSVSPILTSKFDPWIIHGINQRMRTQLIWRFFYSVFHKVHSIRTTKLQCCHLHHKRGKTVLLCRKIGLIFLTAFQSTDSKKVKSATSTLYLPGKKFWTYTYGWRLCLFVFCGKLLVVSAMTNALPWGVQIICWVGSYRLF